MYCNQNTSTQVQECPHNILIRIRFHYIPHGLNSVSSRVFPSEFQTTSV